MKETTKYIYITFAAIKRFGKWFWGEIDNILCVLIAISIIDVITGAICAHINKKFSWALLLRGIYKKLLLFTLIGISNITDVYVLDQAGMLRSTVVFFYLSTEGTSVLKNADQIGLVIPGILKRVISSLPEKGNKNGENSSAE